MSTANTTTRYTIEKEEWTPDGMGCDHALCDQFHKRWHRRGTDGRMWCDKPAGKRIEWLIIDTVTGERASSDGINESYGTRREAREMLDRFLAKVAAQAGSK